MRKKYNSIFVEELSLYICEISDKYKKDNFSWNQPNIKEEIIKEIKQVIKNMKLDINNQSWEFNYLHDANINVSFFGNIDNYNKKGQTSKLNSVFTIFNDEKMLGDFIIYFLNYGIKSFKFLNVREEEEMQKEFLNLCNKNLKIEKQNITQSLVDKTFKIIDLIIEKNSDKFNHLQNSLNVNNDTKPNVLFLMDFDSLEKTKYDTIKQLSLDKFNCLRMDEELISGQITDAIFNRMQESSLNIFDISTLNHNVMLELGYAIALKLPIMIISSKKELKLPFNISGLQCVTFENNSDKIIDLIAKICYKLSL